MEKLYVPYIDNSPVAVDIKGHRLVVLAHSREALLKGLDVLGGEEIREVSVSSNPNEALESLAQSIECGIVITPPGTDVPTLLCDLYTQLPWVH